MYFYLSHPLKGYRTACNLAIQKLLEMAVDLKDKSMEEKRSMLIRCAETTLNSKCLGFLETDLGRNDVGWLGLWRLRIKQWIQENEMLVAGFDVKWAEKYGICSIYVQDKVIQ